MRNIHVIHVVSRSQISDCSKNGGFILKNRIANHNQNGFMTVTLWIGWWLPRRCRGTGTAEACQDPAAGNDQSGAQTSVKVQWGRPLGGAPRNGDWMGVRILLEESWRCKIWIRYASRVFCWSVVVVVVVVVVFLRDGWFDGLCSITIIQFRSWLLADADFSNKPYRLQSHQDWIPKLDPKWRDPRWSNRNLTDGVPYSHCFKHLKTSNSQIVCEKNCVPDV